MIFWLEHGLLFHFFSQVCVRENGFSTLISTILKKAERVERDVKQQHCFLLATRRVIRIDNRIRRHGHVATE